MKDPELLTALEQLEMDIYHICENFFWADDYVFKNFTRDAGSDKILDFELMLFDAINKNFPTPTN